MKDEAKEMKDEALRAYARKVNEWRNDITAYTKKYGIFETVQTEKHFTQILATALIYQAGELLRLFPNLETSKRKEVERATVDLQTHVDKLGQALGKLALLTGAIEYHETPRPGVDYTTVKGIPHRKAREQIDQAGEAYHVANKLAGVAFERLQNIVQSFPDVGGTEPRHVCLNHLHGT